LNPAAIAKAAPTRPASIDPVQTPLRRGLRSCLAVAQPRGGAARFACPKRGRRGVRVPRGACCPAGVVL